MDAILFLVKIMISPGKKRFQKVAMEANHKLNPKEMSIKDSPSLKVA